MKHLQRTAIVAGAALLLALGGCANGDGDSQTTLELWLPPLDKVQSDDKALWDDILSDFEQDNDVDVNVTVVPWADYETKYLTGVSSGDGPDVGYMYGEMIGDYVAKNKLVDMTDSVTAVQKEQLYFLDKGQIDGQQYAMPLVVGGARIFAWNEDLLSKASVVPPTTWTEFIEAGKQLRAAGVNPIMPIWGDPSRGTMNAEFFPFVWQAGGDIFAEDGQSTNFDSVEFLEAAEFLAELQESGVYPDDATGVTPEVARKAFADGEVAFVFSTDQESEKWDQAGINWGHSLSLSNKTQGTFVAADALVMLDGCEDSGLCYDLISYIVEAPQMETFHERAPFPPLSRDEKTSFNPELLKMYTEQSEMLHPLPIVANSIPAYNALYSNLQQLMTGQKTARAALADAAAKGDEALSANP
ncbi:MAG: ABC transporter substrate-binding protein [Arachnia sp.]